MILHQEFSFHHLLLLLHTFLCLRHINIQILHHSVKSPGYLPQFILRISIRHFHMEISLSHQLGSLCHTGQRTEHSSGCHDQQEHSHCHDHKHKNYITGLQIPHHLT